MILPSLITGLSLLSAALVAPAPKAEVKLLNVTESRTVHVDHPSWTDEDRIFAHSFMPENALTISLELKGPAIANATHYGKVQLQKAHDDSGKTIKLHESFKDGLTDLRTDLAQINREMMFFAEQNPPKDAIKIDLRLTNPSRNATYVALERGSIAVQTGDVKEITINNIGGQFGKPLADKTLKQAGVMIVVDQPKKGDSMFFGGEPGKAWTVTVTGESDNMLDVDIVTGTGEELNSSSMWSELNDATKHTLFCDQTIPQEASLRVKVSVNSKVVQIPFAFPKIELP